MDYDKRRAKELPRDLLEDYYIDYQKLKEETEGYKEHLITSRCTTYFIPLYSFLASCIAIAQIYKDISLVALCLTAIIPAAISVFILSVIKHFIEYEYAHYKKSYVPALFYIILAILIPVACYFIF